MFSTETCNYFIHQHPDTALGIKMVFLHALACTKNIQALTANNASALSE